MGMDLIPKKRVESAHWSWWTWRPLWAYAAAAAGLSKRRRQMGEFNDEELLDATTADRLARVLRARLDAGEVALFLAARDAQLDGLPDLRCKYCRGTGTRTDMTVADGCNACRGRGKVRPDETMYRFTAQDVEELADFAARSGGFQFC